MQLTDPNFIEMLDDNPNFKEEEFESFGKSFLPRVVKEAEDEEALNRHRVEHRQSQRGYRPSGRKFAGGSSHFRHQFSSNRVLVNNRFISTECNVGRLQFFADKWKVISNDPWILILLNQVCG